MRKIEKEKLNGRFNWEGRGLQSGIGCGRAASLLLGGLRRENGIKKNGKKGIHRKSHLVTLLRGGANVGMHEGRRRRE